MPERDAGAGAEVVGGQLAGHIVGGGVFDFGVGVPGYGVTDAAESVGAGGLQGVEDGFNVVAQVEVGVADDGSGGAGVTVNAAGAGGGLALDKFDFADGTQLFGAAGAVHGAGLDENGGADVVAAADVVQQFRGAGSVGRGFARGASPKGGGGGRRWEGRVPGRVRGSGASQSLPPKGMMGLQDFGLVGP